MCKVTPFELLLRAGLFLEMFLTSQLVLVVFMLAVEKHKSTFLAPIGIGFTLFIEKLSAYIIQEEVLTPPEVLDPVLSHEVSVHTIGSIVLSHETIVDIRAGTVHGSRGVYWILCVDKSFRSS